MSTLNLIVNDIWDDCLILDYLTASSGTTNLFSVAEGDRYLNVSTDGDTVSYINKSTTMTADTLIMTRADTLVGENVLFKNFSDYPSGESTIYNGTGFDPTLVGYEDQDFYYEFTTASGDAFGVAMPADSYLYQVYFGTRIEFDYINDVIDFEPVSERVIVENKYYTVDQHYFITLTDVDSDSIAALNSKELNNKLVFLYDESGKHFTDKLMHCIMVNRPKVQIFDNIYSVSFDVYRLQGYE